MPVLRRLEDPFDRVGGLLHDQLRPDVDGGELAPALVDLLDVDGVLDVHELEQVEQEERHVGVRPGGDVGHRRDPGDARVELAEVDVVGVQVDEHVDLEEALVALLRETVAEPAYVLDRGGPLLEGERLGEQVVAAPAALVRRQLGIAGEVGHERADDGAVRGDAGLDGGRLVVDALHHLELLVDDVLGDGVEVRLRLDEERGLAGVAVRRLHDQVGAEPVCHRRGAAARSTTSPCRARWAPTAAPASLPSWVVTILESRRRRSSSDGMIRL